MQRVGVLVKAMTELLPTVGIASELGQALHKAIGILGKHVPPGTNSNAADKNQIEKMAIQNQQNAGMQQALKAQGQPQQPPASMPPKPAQPMPQAAGWIFSRTKRPRCRRRTT